MPRPMYRDLTDPDKVKMKPFEGDRLMGGASEYIGPGSSDKAGAGRGKQGGPTAKELADYERKQDEGIYTAEKGKAPQEPEGRKKGGMIKKMASGGMTASSRADGIAMRGKTRGKIC
jgi:hypothetical protein